MISPEHRLQNSITRSILARQLNVLLLCPQDTDGLTLLSQLGRIGCVVEMCWPPPQEIKSSVDLIFLSILPDMEEINYEWLHHCPPPIISVTSFENPIVIDEALRIGVMGMLTAPVRAAGLLSTMIMVLSHKRQYEKMAVRISRLESKFTNFRVIEEGKAIVMRMIVVNETEAYEMMRSQAQSLRQPIEDVAKNLIHANKVLSQTFRGKADKPKGKIRGSTD